jgi:TfoX/Sxy family transcriptional regulator of competence genes
MAYDEALANRIRSVLAGDPALTEKKMFGGIAFLDRGLMFAGVTGNKLMARVGKEHYQDSLAYEHVREMDFTGKPMQGYVYVEPSSQESDGPKITEQVNPARNLLRALSILTQCSGWPSLPIRRKRLQPLSPASSQTFESSGRCLLR